MNSVKHAKTIRVAQLNLLNAKDGEDYRYRFLSYWMNEINPDILSLQEVRNPDKAESALISNGFIDFVWAHSVSEKGVVDHTGIASKSILIDKQTIDFVSRPVGVNPMSMGAININDGIFYMLSAHLTWGMTNENQRLGQVSEISKLAEGVVGGNDVFLLGSDMNADDNSRTVRYMKGLDLGLNNEDTSYWIDAYDFVAPYEKNSVWATTDQGSSYWGRETAARHGILFPQLLPQRRINYIFSHGWRYGKRGCPVSYYRFGEPCQEHGFNDHLSDHYGIYSDILI